MKKFNRKAIMSSLISASLVLVACSETKIIEKEKKTVTVSDTMDSKSLTDAGEQLMSPYTLNLADKVFDMALQKDPENLKAQFYKKFLAPHLVVLKGSFKRFRPYVQTYGNIQQWDQGFKKFPNSPLKEYLADGPEDIKTSADVQNLLDQVANGYLELRNFLAKNQAAELNLYLNPHIFAQQIQQNTVKSCVVTTSPENNVSTIKCDFTEVAQVKLNTADLISLRQMAAGQVLMYAIYNSYSVDGIEKLIGKKFESAQEGQAAIEALPDFAKLRGTHMLTKVQSIGSDALAAYKWAVDYQKSLCPQGYSTYKNRKGYLIENGLCIDEKTQKEVNVALLEQALNGVINMSIKSNTGQMVDTKINYLAMFRNPVADLRSIAPASYDKCDNALTLRDNSLGGIYPDNNASLFIDKKACK